MAQLRSRLMGIPLPVAAALMFYAKERAEGEPSPAEATSRLAAEGTIRYYTNDPDPGLEAALARTTGAR